MKTTKLHIRTAALALGTVLFATSAFSKPMNNPIPTQSKITAATVYTDRAIVTRNARVELLEGETLIVLEKMPASLIDASVQVSGRGTAAVSILDVTTNTTHVATNAEVDQPRVNTLREEIEAIEQTLAAINARQELLNHQAELIEKIENAISEPAGDGAHVRPGMDDLQKMMTFSVDARAKLITDRQKLANEEKQTENKRQALYGQLNEITRGSRGDRRYKTVTVRVVAAKAGSFDLTAAYTVGSASWTPSYDSRLRSDERAVELSYYGNVRQSTGEDWSDIALTLSTAKPSLGGAAPVLAPWIVDVFVPRPVLAATRRQREDEVLKEVSVTKSQAFNMKAMVSAPAAEMSADKMDADFVDARYVAATVDNSATSASFKIVATATIPSDNTHHKVNITVTKLPATLQYQATPAMQETAFLSAYVSNTTEFPFLAGPTNIFLDEAFVSTSALKTVMPLEKFEVSLGADEGVAIKRRIVNRFSENTGLTSKGRRVTYELLVTITNNKKTAERVVFKEALPLSRNEKIVVNLLTPAEREVGTAEKPGKEASREEDNKLVWRLDMKPGEKREIPVKFNVEYPGDIQVTGME